MERRGRGTQTVDSVLPVLPSTVILIKKFIFSSTVCNDIFVEVSSLNICTAKCDIFII